MEPEQADNADDEADEDVGDAEDADTDDDEDADDDDDEHVDDVELFKFVPVTALSPNIAELSQFCLGICC